MRLILVRHPALLNAEGLCYGRQELPVSPSSLNAGVDALRPWQGLPVFSSPANRCLMLASALNTTVEVCEELKEMDFGAWEGQRWSDIPESDIGAWAADIWHYRPGGGESAAMLRHRWQTLLERWRRQPLALAIVVSHAGLIRMALAEAGKLAADRRWDAPIPYATPLTLDI